jgi:tRNA(Ile)-lysidine synthase
VKDALPIGAAEAGDLFGSIEARRLLVGVSGGPDSLALLLLLHRWAAAQGDAAPQLHAATIDHGLRPESAGEAAFVASVCAGLRVPHAVLPWVGDKPATALQEEAREMRIRLLGEHAMAIEADAVLLGHHLDDQAETILMRLCRGSGLRGLSGIHPLEIRGIDSFVYRVARPLLEVPKARLVATCQAFGVTPVDDPSNRDPRFARTRMRALLPLLAAEGLGAAGFGRLARRVMRADEALHVMAHQLEKDMRSGSEEDGERYQGDLLLGVPDEFSLRVLDVAIRRHATEGEPELAALEDLHEALLDALCDSKPFSRTLAGAWVRIRRGGVVQVGPAPKRRSTTPRARRDKAACT